MVRALRAKHNPMHLPIIAIGGRSGEEELVQSLEAGANDFFVKPLSKVELVARIDAQVGEGSNPWSRDGALAATHVSVLRLYHCSTPPSLPWQLRQSRRDTAQQDPQLPLASNNMY